MELTAQAVDEAVREYPAVQPLSAVETEHLELLPDSFERGNFGWRDAEWVVQWYFRRFLGSYPDAERRAVEDAYGENGFEDVRAAIAAAVAADEAVDALDRLTTLEGVDVPIGSAFLQFVDPDRYVVVGEREWTALRERGAIEDVYPEPPTAPKYERYLGACRTLADRCECDLWDLYRALWVLTSGAGPRE
jgi:hypothetical protein